MGKKAVKQYFQIVFLVASIILFIFTLVGLYGGDVNPAGHNVRALSTLALPILIALNILVLIFWAIRRSWYFIIPLVSILFSIKYIGTIFQIGGKPESVASNFTIATYNVRSFNRDITGVVAADVTSSLKKENADIICMQEFDNEVSGDKRSVCEKFLEGYPYKAVCKDLIIISRFPLKKSKEIPFELSNNAGMWADVQIDKSHTIRVFNVHMETTGINSTLHQAAKMDPDIQEGGMPLKAEVASNVMDNYMLNSAIRSGQAITIANEKIESPHPIVLCGDFNDVPYSFTYHTLKGDLMDGFKQGGHGFASTYRGAKGLFRIDYIFNAETMESLDYYTVDQDYSDHNPVYSKIAFK